MKKRFEKPPPFLTLHISCFSRKRPLVNSKYDPYFLDTQQYSRIPRIVYHINKHLTSFCIKKKRIINEKGLSWTELICDYHLYYYGVTYLKNIGFCTE